MVLVALFSLHVSAQLPFNYNGLKYEIKNGREAALVSGNGIARVTIAASVEYNGKQYPVTSIKGKAFENSDVISVIIPNSVKSIGEQAFWCCENLTYVSIPNSVTSIGGAAFHGCSSLTSVTIPNSVTSIGSSAFYECTSLTSITIPESVTSIGDCVFTGCSALESIDIPNSVTSIGQYAFSRCKNLTSVNIPNSVKSIGDEAFEECQRLKSVNIPDGVTSIGYGVFYFCQCLSSIEIPNSVTSIGAYAFYKCFHLASVNIPNSVKSIGKYAFYNCIDLTSVSIPNSVTSIGDWAFANCPHLASLEMSNGVTSIGASAFKFCYVLTSVSIPNSVTSIGENAFYQCMTLTSVSIPNSVTSIGNGAFYECNRLKSVTLDNNWIVSACSIANIFDSRVEEYIIGNNVISIRTSAFKYFHRLKSVTISEGVLWIDECAFSECDSLTSVSIPNSVTSIGASAFQYCYRLTSVNIPNSVTSIGEKAFSSCSDLTSVTIGNCVTSIGDDAFYGCKSLKSVVSKIEKPFAIVYPHRIEVRFNVYSTLKRSVFSGINKECVLTVPKGTKDAYIAAAGWTKDELSEQIFKGGIIEAGSEPEPEPDYKVGDDITSLATAEWEGKTGDYGGLANPSVERYINGVPEEVGDILTQTISGLRNGTYCVQLEAAASFTSGRGFECPTGDGLSVAFANGTQRNLPVWDRGWVSEWQQKLVTLTATVTDGTLKYGIKNLALSGNWFVARLKSIVYVSSNAQSPKTYAISIASEKNGKTTTDVTADEEGSRVFITTTPEDGCTLESLKVTTTGGKTVELTGNSFIMPASAVTVTAIYRNESEPISRRPFDGEINLPGTIEAENYDVGGEGVAYHDNEPENKGDADYRKDEGVDIVAGNGGKVVGWTNEGEWTEYTVNVINAGKYTYEATVSSGVGNGGFSINVVGEGGSITKLADVDVSQTSSWDTYQTVMGDLLQELAPGTQIIRIILTKGNCNIDKVKFDLKEEDPADLSKDMYHVWDGCTATSKVTDEDGGGAYNVGAKLSSGVVYGDGSVNYTRYANLTGYNTLLITGTPGMELRVLLNRLEVGNGGGDENGGAWIELNPVIGTDGQAVVDLSGYEFVHLNAIKLGWESPEGIIESLKVSKEFFEQPVTVTANDLTMVYGDNVPALTYKSEGAELNGTPKLSTTATKASAVGTYPIKVETGTVKNANATYVDGTLTITKASLTVGVQDVTITEGDAIPTFTLTYSGWKNSDTEATAFTTKPTAKTTATTTSKAGTYDITVSGGTAKNYELSYTKGKLTILKKDESEPDYKVGDDITSLAVAEWEGKTGDYGGLANPSVERYINGVPEEVGDILTQTISGLRNGTYCVQLEAAASFTSGRGFECPTGDGLSVAFANGTQRNLPVWDRGWVSEWQQKLVTLTATVTDGTLKYGIKNLALSGNWFVARLKSIVYVSSNAQSPKTYAISIASEKNGKTTTDVTADEEGSRVFITTTPEDGCTLESLKVTTTGGKTVELTGNSFIMPASAVTVTATYKAPEQPKLAGDANGDGTVNVFDVTAMVNYILGSPNDGFVFAAADVNGDGIVNVFDVTKVVNIILGVDNSEAKTRKAEGLSGTDKLYFEDFEIEPGEELEVEVLLDNPGAEYRDLQFDLYLPEGITVVQDEDEEFMVDKGDRCTKKHTIGFSYTDGHYVCMLYSTAKNPLSGNSGDILTITLKADDNVAPGAKTGSFRNVSLSKTDATGPTYDEFSFGFTVKGADGIEDVIADDGEFQIYTLDGKLVETLQQGVNILRYSNGTTKSVYVK